MLQYPQKRAVREIECHLSRNTGRCRRPPARRTATPSSPRCSSTAPPTFSSRTASFLQSQGCSHRSDGQRGPCNSRRCVRLRRGFHAGQIRTADHRPIVLWDRTVGGCLQRARDHNACTDKAGQRLRVGRPYAGNSDHCGGRRPPLPCSRRNNGTLATCQTSTSQSTISTPDPEIVEDVLTSSSMSREPLQAGAGVAELFGAVLAAESGAVAFALSREEEVAACMATVGPKLPVPVSSGGFGKLYRNLRYGSSMSVWSLIRFRHGRDG